MFNNIPPNGFPQIPDIEDLEAVVEDVKTLKTTAAVHAVAITGLENNKDDTTNIAPTFSADSNYSVGDLVYYEGTLYECTTAHEAAAWDAEDFTAATIAGEINGLNSKITGLVKQGSVSITVANGTSTGSAYLTVDTVRITRDRMIGVLIGKNDDVYYTPVIASVNTDGAIELRVIAATPPDTDRTYNIIVSYI